jgi:hypothetical protein
MDVPSEDELAAIAAAYLMLLREPSPPAPPVSRWRLAARALERAQPQRTAWRVASRSR